MVIKRVYIFDQVNLQAVINLENREKPEMLLDWGEDVSKLGLLISTKMTQAEEIAGKPVFKYGKDIAFIAGQYTIVAMIENEEKERIKKILSRIYKTLLKEKPVTSNEMGEIAIKVLEKS
ncbi:MAG: hypothetical protein ACP6IP_06520 [Candidatus Njordarchaeia archaeon]